MIAAPKLARDLGPGRAALTCAPLADERRMAAVRENVCRQREQFPFAHHVERPSACFRRAIEARSR